MMTLLKIISLCCLLTVSIQDFKERNLYAWLLLAVGILLSLSYFLETKPVQYMANIGMNLGIIALMIAVLYLYAKLKLKTALSEALGLGDILFFISMAIGFPLGSFIVLFSFSLFFSLVVYIMLKPSLKGKNVPLAGLQSIFLFFVLGVNWIFPFVNLYNF